jgi:xanthine dehydrogenase YagR molybdenum-binding subunit
MANQNSSISVVKSSCVPRIDGPKKVAGVAKYTSDHSFPGLAFAVPVGAKIAAGRVTEIDSKDAERTKGVLAVYTRSNIGPIYRPTASEDFAYKVDEARPPFEDDVIRYYGQYVAIVVAETLEIAQSAARGIKVSYSVDKPRIEGELKQEESKKTESERGDVAKAFAKAAVKIEHTYETPIEVHNPIEMHATVAVWDENQDKVTLYETSQAIGTQRNVLAMMLGVPRENVRVVSEFLGSGFGGKLWAWPHSALAAASARKLKRPVKLVLDRSMMFTNVGYRPRTSQTIQIGATREGKIESLSHVYTSQGDMLSEYKENCGEVSALLYGSPNCFVSSGLSRRHKGVPTAMRGPGAVPGLFALESAMDELAIALKMDPVELRKINDTKIDGSSGKPFSSRHFKECLELGAKKFGWAKRSSAIGSMKDGDEILGWGVAACSWPAHRWDAKVSIEMRADGRVRVASGTHDIGTGMYTVLGQVVSTELGLPIDRIDVALGDTSLPPGPIAGGSMATASVIPAVIEAVKAIKKNFSNVAIKTKSSAFFGAKPNEVTYQAGFIQGPKGKVEFAKFLQSLNMAALGGVGEVKGSMSETDPKFATHSFGAHFIEIGWHPELARLRVRRVVSVIDGGRIINFQPARNQIEGAIIMGIGMGLFEESEYDPRYGHPANGNLADYIVPVHADCPDIDVTFLDYPDKAVNEWGARGVGEIGLAGVASAITAAVYHATGVRVRELPVTLEKLLKPLV